MAIYIFLIILLFIFSFFDFFKVSIANKIMFLLCSFIVIFIAGFRYGLDTDYWSYYDIFKGVKDKSNYELGYIFISDIIYTVTNNFNYFLVIIAIVFLGYKCKIFEKFSYPFIILLVYYLKFFVLLELNVIRQGIAVTFILIAIYELWKQRTKKFFFFVIIASFFHLSSIFFLIVYPFRNVNWTYKKIFISVLILIIFRLFLLSPILSIGSPLLEKTGDGLVFNALKYVFANPIPTSSIILSIIRVLIPTLCIFHLLEKTNDRIFFNIYFLGVWINIIFMGMDTIGYRLALLFYSCEGMAISQGLQKKNLKTLFFILPILSLDLISFFSIIKNSNFAVPYRCFWFVDPNMIIQ